MANKPKSKKSRADRITELTKMLVEQRTANDTLRAENRRLRTEDRAGYYDVCKERNSAVRRCEAMETALSKGRDLTVVLNERMRHVAQLTAMGRQDIANVAHRYDQILMGAIEDQMPDANTTLDEEREIERKMGSLHPDEEAG